MKTGYDKGHKEYAGAYKGLKAVGTGPKTVTNSTVHMSQPGFRPMGGKMKKKKGHNPGY